MRARSGAAAPPDPRARRSFVYAPGRVAAGATQTLTHAVDVVPTLLGFAGRAPGLAAVDGRDARSSWRSGPDDRMIVLHYDNVNRCGAVARGRFKYVLDGACGYETPEYAGWEDDPTAPLNCLAGAECLFDLHADPTERDDVSGAHPVVLGALRSALLRAEAVAVPSRVFTTPGDPNAAPDRHGGAWVSWLDSDS